MREAFFPSRWERNVSDLGDFVQLTYDINGNITQRQLRDGQLISYSYDALDRVTTMTPPSPMPAVNYSYDLQGRLLQAHRPGDGVIASMSYDALGRQLTDGQTFGGMTYQYDLAGRRTRATWNDGFFVTYDRLTTGELTAVRENGAGSGPGVLVSYAYNNLGQRTATTRGNGGTSSFGYDAIGRLASLSHNLGGTIHDVTTKFSYNSASQIASLSRSNAEYRFQNHVNVDGPYTNNGLNQVTSAGGTSFGYDGRGNLSASGSATYGYDAFNQLRSSSSGISADHDTMGRLIELELAKNSSYSLW